MVWAGYAAIAVSVIWVVVKLYMAYHSAGGINVVVVYDAAVYPPILAAVGLYLVLPSLGIYWAAWVYVVIWAVTCAITAGAIRLMERLGDRPF